jgi:histidine ammonia-lyase
LRTSAPLQAALSAFRSEVAALGDDRYLAPDLAHAAALVANGALSKATGINLPDLT